MTAADEVREALMDFKPEHSVMEAYWARYGESSHVPLGQRVIVFISSDDPESYRADIESLLLQAGLTDIHLELEIKHPPET